MPITSHDSQRRIPRFREQRWLLDAVIKVAGPEWDQNRLHSLSAPMSPDYKGSVLALQALVKRFDDIAPMFAAVARRFELHAEPLRRKDIRSPQGTAFSPPPSCTAVRNGPFLRTPL